VFQFLLDREPKVSILRRFDVTGISRYFPEFRRYLSPACRAVFYGGQRKKVRRR
jgi:hypothetical protein